MNVIIVAVADTNILASAIADPGGIPGAIFEAAKRGVFTLVISVYVIDELQRVLARTYFAARVSVGQSSRELNSLFTLATLVVPDPSIVGVCRDPKDDAVLGTAVAAQASYLVTGDRDLLALGRYRDVRIVTAQEFLVLLEAAGEPEGDEQPV